MPDVDVIAAALAGLRQDRHGLTSQAPSPRPLRRAPAGPRQRHGTRPPRLAYIQAIEGRLHFVALDGKEVVGNTTYTLVSTLALLADHPQILQVSADHLVNFHCVHAIGRAPTKDEGKLLYLKTSTPQPIPFLEAFWEPVRAFFGLSTIEHVIPWNDRYEALMEENVRTYDDDIAGMDVDTLRREFRYATTGELNIRELMANLIWQYHTWLDPQKRGRGEAKHHKKPIDGNIRTFWYYMKPLMSRLDVLDPDPQYEQMLDVFNKFVGRARLFHYRDFGFDDGNSTLRSIGTQYPHILLISEKNGHYAQLQRLQQEFGFSIIAQGGQPSMLTAVYFNDELSVAIPDLEHTTLRLIFLVDFDPAGNIGAMTFQRVLAQSASKH